MRWSWTRIPALVLLASIAATGPVAASSPAVACGPDDRWSDVPDGMTLDGTTCELRDSLVLDAAAWANELGVSPATALQGLRMQQRVDQLLGTIEVRNPDTFAGFQWTWPHDSVVLVARFKERIPFGVVADLARAGVPTRYVLVERTLHELDDLATTTAVLLGQLGRDWAAGVDGLTQRVVGSISSDGLSAEGRARIEAFMTDHPDVHIDIIDGPVVELFSVPELPR